MEKRKTSIIPVREQIFNRVKEDILTNEYKAGEIIPIEKLARDFGVSATPIREALIRLENSGLVELIPNKGAQVTIFTEKDILNTWELRKILEPYAGKLTCTLDISSEIARLKGMIDLFNKQEYDFNYYVQIDNDIHEMFFIHIDNSLLKEMMGRIHHLSMRMRYFAEGADKNHETVINEVNSEHIEILDAFEKGDPEKVEQLIYSHILNSEKRTIKFLP